MMQNYEYFFPKYYRVYLQNLGLGCPVGETASEEKEECVFVQKPVAVPGKNISVFDSSSQGVGE